MEETIEALTKKEFFSKINEAIKQMPSNWRKGQKVFNAIDAIFGVAREVQFHHKVDCFHNDENIETFKEKSYEIYKERLNIE